MVLMVGLLISPTRTNGAPGREARNRDVPEKCWPRRITIQARTAKSRRSVTCGSQIIGWSSC